MQFASVAMLDSKVLHPVNHQEVIRRLDAVELLNLI